MRNTRYPVTVIDYNVYSEDGIKLIGVTTLQLPSIEATTQEIKGVGILGTFDDPISGMFNSMVATMNFNWMDASANVYAIGQRVMFDCRVALGALEMPTLRNIAIPERVNLVGKVKKYDPGKREVSTAADASMEIEIGRMQQWIGGREVMLFDRISYIYRVNGKDILADIRTAIGG